MAIKALRAVYDEIFAKHYDTQLTTDNIRTYYQNNPSENPNSLMRYVFLDPQQAGRGLAEAQRMTEVFCTIPGVSSAKRGEDSMAPPGTPSPLGVVVPRRISRYPTSKYLIPDLNTILRGILNGDLSLHYARWQYPSGQGGPMLELAYWIGRTPGVADGEPGAGDVYRDWYTPDGDVPDRWVVMHLHINIQTEWLRVFRDGRTCMGVQSLQFFHRYRTQTEPGRAWRVHVWRTENYGRNQRGGMNCRDHLPGGLWYVGAPLTIDRTNPSQVNFQAWSERLFNSGYTSSRGLRLILTGQSHMANGDVEPHRPFRIVQTSESHPDWGANMWDTNWLVDGDGFDFAPQPPPT